MFASCENVEMSFAAELMIARMREIRRGKLSSKALRQRDSGLVVVNWPLPVVKRSTWRSSELGIERKSSAKIALRFERDDFSIETDESPR